MPHVEQAGARRQLVALDRETADHGPVDAQRLRYLVLAGQRQSPVGRRPQFFISRVPLFPSQHVARGIGQARRNDLRKAYRKPVKVGARALVLEREYQDGARGRRATQTGCERQ